MSNYNVGAVLCKCWRLDAKTEQLNEVLSRIRPRREIDDESCRSFWIEYVSNAYNNVYPLETSNWKSNFTLFLLYYKVVRYEYTSLNVQK